jgi:uncharacterized protein (DUF885 family)
MKTVILILLAIFGTLQSCQTGDKNKDMENTRNAFNKTLENYYEAWKGFYPLEATMAGDERFNDTFPNDLSIQYLQALESFYKEYNSKIDSFDYDKLDAQQQMSYDILKWQFQMELEGLQFKWERFMPIDQFWSTNIQIAQMASGQSIQPFETASDYDAWLRRLDDYLVWCDTALVNMKKGMEIGYVLPRPLIEKVLPQLSVFAMGPVGQHLFYQPVLNMPDGLTAEERKTIAGKYKNYVEEKIIPAYAELYSFFKDEYLPQGRETSGFINLEGGLEAYGYLVRLFTSTDMTADAVFELGKREVERLTQEMEKVKAQIGFEGTLHEFFDHVRTNPKLMPYTDPQQVIGHFNAIHKKMQPQLEKLFDKVPQTPFEVRRTEAFREASSSAQYSPGSLDGSRPGIFYVPIPNVEKYNIFSDEDLFLHEAIPGHHYQISLQQENDSLPAFRKILWITAYGEGWALYCESLGKELGLYTDPYQYFGMLSAEMHRAIRLVVDVGIHAKGWSREEAIAYSLAHEAESEESIVSEIERYMAGPGQALSYKIGQLKILELRKRAEEELGSSFDIRQFHNQVLDAGCLPLVILERKILKWINDNKTNV